MADALNNIKKILEEKIEFDNGGFFHNYAEETINKKNVLLESAEKFGTPQYFLDEAKLKKRALFFMNTFKQYLTDSEFFYAFKCNDLPFLVKSLKELGYNADVASLFELKLALKLGFDKIIFTGPGKEDEELKLAMVNSDKVILNIDNFDELENLIKIINENKNNKLNISIRLNPHDSVTEVWSKFGIELNDLKKAVEKIKKHPQLRLKGLHFHCSWNDTPKKYLENIKLIGEYLKANFSNEELFEFEFIDIGGGFYPEGNALLFKDTDKGKLLGMLSPEEADPNSIIIENVEPLENFGKAISEALKNYIFPLNKNLKIYFEPGRFITVHSTAILTRAISIKNKNSIIVDGGINLVGDYRFSEYSFAPIVNLGSPSLKLNKKIIYGPLCDPSDLWGYSFFGDDVKKGDVLAVLNQGAYTFSCAWRFIKPTAPYIVLTEKNELVAAKEKEKFEERYFGCKF